MPEAGLLEMLRRWAEAGPHAPALLAPGRAALGRRGLEQHVREGLGALACFGVGRGDRVALVLPDGPEMAAAFLTVAAGAASAPLNPALTPRELEAAFEELGPRAVVVPSGEGVEVAAIARGHGIAVVELMADPAAPAGRFALRGEPGVRRAETHPGEGDDVALVLQTSGTTARPKRVPLSHRNLLASAEHISGTLRLGPEDRCLGVMPLFHIHGLVGALLASLASGGSVACAPGFQAPRFLDWLRELNVTWYTAVPTMHQAVLARARAHPEAARGTRLRMIRSSSAALPPTLLRELEAAFGVPVIESYGMTEAAHQMASNPLPPAQRKPGSVGPAAGPEIAVLRPDGERLGTGETGEIVIRGPNVTRGYEANPEADALAFTGGWFRTGDQGYLDEDGYLHVTGRLKELINRGGEKIAPREVDEALLEHPAVAQALAFAVPHPRLGEEVAAAVVLKPGAALEAEPLRGFAAERLARFKVPDRIVFLDELPKGPTGKPQRVGLARRLGIGAAVSPPAAARAATSPDAPRLEAQLAAIWSEVLEVDAPPGGESDFFALGGDSVLAAQVAARVRERLGLELPLLDFFDGLTVGDQARRLEGRAVGPEPAPVRRSGARRDRPLSFAQERLWLIDRLQPRSPAYNRPFGLRLEGALDVDALGRALDALVERHEPLRTVIALADGGPVTRPVPGSRAALELVDIEAHPASVGAAEADRRADAEAGRPFEIGCEPPVRAALLRLGPEEHRLVVTLHHVACDAWSVGILERELLALYAAFRAGDPSPLPPLPFDYGDAAAWQRERLAGPALEAGLGWWRAELGGPPGPAPLELPTDRPRPPEQSGLGGTVRARWPHQVAEGVRRLARRGGATPFTVLLAAFQALLHRLTGRDDVAVGSAVAGRPLSALEALAGLFVNTVVLRGDLSGDPTFAELLDRARGVVAGAHAHQEVPFEKVVEALSPPRRLGRTPLFQVMLVMENAPSPALEAPGLRVSRFEPQRGGALFDLTLYLRDTRGAGIEAALEFDAALYERASAARILGQLRTLLEDAVAAPERRLSELALADTAETARLVEEWRRPVAAPPAGTVASRFRRAAERAGDRVALRADGRTASFRELDAWSDALAHRLVERGLPPEGVVAIAHDPGIEHAVAVLASLKAGGAVLALDRADPPDRRRALLEDARAWLVLAPPGDPAPEGTLPRLEVEASVHAASGGATPLDRARPDGLAWVVYTSGTTGRPKGVALEHRAILNRLGWSWSALPFEPGEACCWKTPVAFADTIVELWTPLLEGVPVTRIPETVVRDPVALVAALREAGVSRLLLVPSLLRALLAGVPDLAERLPALRLWISSGDALGPELRRRFAEAVPDRRLVDAYGATEALDACGDEARPAEAWRETIGHPLPGVRASVFDAGGRPLPAGVAGEIRVGGACLARCYLGDAALTAERFPHDPHGTGRVFLTGDRGRRLPDGRLEFLGRRDGQVEVRGVRIELGELEASLRAHPGVEEAVAFTRPDAAGETALHACAVVRDETDAAELRRQLRSRLPRYALPATLQVLDALPMTRSGKVDRNALRLPSHDGAAEAPAFVAPHGATQQRLAGIWARLLGGGPVGARDDFFDAGGSSLLAVQLSVEVERVFGRVLPTSAIFAAPTLEALAARLEGDVAQPGGSAVAFPSAGERPPLFCVPGAGGLALRLRDLARRLAAAGPVYALHPPGVAAERAPLARMEALGRHYVDEIRTVQPQGPYFLAGYSLGGAAAWETARQLEAAGERVALLALIDAPFPRRPLGVRAREFAGALRRRLRRPLGEGVVFAPPPTETGLETALRAVRVANRHAFHAYRPRRRSGRLVVLSLARPATHRVYAGVEAWTRLATGVVERHAVPGTHLSLLDEPHVEHVARILGECLERAAPAMRGLPATLPGHGAP